MKTVVKKEELKEYIGKNIGTSDWLTVTQDQVNMFADATHDHQFIHVDPEAAAKTPFGGPIAHGFLSLSLLAHFAQDIMVAPENQVMGINYGLDKVRFLMPVRVGKRIRCHSKLLDVVEKKPNHFLFTTEMTIEIEGEDKPALIAVWLTMAVTGAVTE
jgi:acyl dehydratase